MDNWQINLIAIVLVILSVIYLRKAKKIIIYEALYNHCIYEGGTQTISLHLSKQGAEKAIAEHKAARFNELLEIYKTHEEVNELLEMEMWGVSETEVKP